MTGFLARGCDFYAAAPSPGSSPSAWNHSALLKESRSTEERCPGWNGMDSQGAGVSVLSTEVFKRSLNGSQTDRVQQRRFLHWPGGGQVEGAFCIRVQEASPLQGGGGAPTVACACSGLRVKGSVSSLSGKAILPEIQAPRGAPGVLALVSSPGGPGSASCHCQR